VGDGQRLYGYGTVRYGYSRPGEAMVIEDGKDEEEEEEKEEEKEEEEEEEQQEK